MDPRHTTMDTPLGELTLVAEGDALTGLYFEKHWYLPSRDTFGPRDDTGFEEVRDQLGDYFDGRRTTFDLRLDPHGDDFQQRIWSRLQRIPSGETTTYGTLAEELGEKSLARRVGGAVGRNPISIVIPCHRVVGADGGLTGYAGGLPRKAWLLDLEASAEVRASRLF